MPKPIAVLVADAHLQERAWLNKPVAGDAYHSFTQVIDAALFLEVPVISAGDLIDKRVNGSEPIVFLSQQLQRLHAVGLDFCGIQGQHELSTTPWMNLSPSAFSFHRAVYLLKGIPVYGIDYQPAGKLQEELALVPKSVDFLVTHQVWSDFMGEVAFPQGGCHEVPHARVMLTGDFHERKTLNVRGAQGQDLRVVSLGSTCMQEISEPRDKYYGVLYDDLTVAYRQLATRPVLLPSMLLSEEDLEEFLETLPELLTATWDAADALPDHIRRPLLRYEVIHNLPDAVRRIAKVVGDRAILFPRVLPPEEAPSAILAKTAGHALTLEGCLPLLVNKDADPGLYNLAARLLASPAPAVDELRKWVVEETVDVV